MVYHPEADADAKPWNWPPGHFYWKVGECGPVNGQRYLWMRLPSDDEGSSCCIRVRPLAEGAIGSAWEWDGNIEKPTLTESVWHHSEPDWHGWIRDGVMVGCP
jgi:hypothetical protein